MKKTFKSTLSLLLALVMVFSLGISAFADTDDDVKPLADMKITVDSQTGNEISVTKYVGNIITITPSDKSNPLNWTITGAEAVFVDVSSDGKTVTEKGATSPNTTGAVKVLCKTATSSEPVKITIDGTTTKCILTIGNNAVEKIITTSGNSSADVDTVYTQVNKPVTLNANVKYSAGAASSDGKMRWTHESGSVCSLNRSDDNPNTIVVTPSTSISGTEVFRATWTDKNSTPAETTKDVTIKTTTVNSIDITSNTEALTVVKGKSITLTATPKGTDGKDTTTTATEYSWTTSDATADSDKKIVTATASTTNKYTIKGANEGTVTVTCVIDGVSATKTITVKDSSNVSAKATIGTNLSMNQTKTEIASLFSAVNGVSLSNTDKITITLPGTTEGTLYKADKTAATNGEYTLAEFAAMYFTPASPTTKDAYSITYSATNSVSKESNAKAKTLTGNINITVSSPSVDAKATVITKSSAFGFNDTNSNTSTSIQSQISTKLSSLSYITFDTTSIKNNQCGSINVTKSDDKYYLTRSLFSSNKLISEVTFTPTAATGVYSINYTAYSTSGQIAEGTISVSVQNQANTDVSATVVAGSKAIGMNDTNDTTKESIQTQLTAKIKDLSYVTFDESSITGSTTGTLSAKKDTKYYITKSALSSNVLLSTVTFTPSTVSGKYTIGFTGVDSTGAEFPGTLAITVSPMEYVFQFGAEGYTFKASDFIKSTDTDPIKTVSFTLPSSGVLYTNYSYGKGTAVAKANSFTSSTLGTLTYIPSANYPIDVNISFTATTNAGKTISGVAKMDYIDRTATLKFTDVTASWAIPAVDFCSTWGIATGTGTGTFNPNGTMQRGMLVTMLYRVAGQPNVSGYANPFKDVYVSDYYFNAVVWAYNMGIVKGTTTTTFSPNNAVSRQDIAVMLARFEGVKTYNVNYIGNYKDASNVASYATVAMNWAVGNGIISGNNGYLTPTATGTRAQVAAMLHRYLAK